MNNPIHFGLIGCGRVAPRAIVSRIADARLVAVADVIEARALRFASEYHIDTHTDYRHLLARQDADAVSGGYAAPGSPAWMHNLPIPLLTLAAANVILPAKAN
jgi:hypothetical protein